MSKYLQDQRGIGLVIVIVLVAVIGAAGAFAYLNFQKAKDSGGGASLIPGKVTLNGDCELKDTDLCKFVNNWKVNGNYSINGTTTKGAEKSTLLMEIEGEKKSHMMTTSAGQESYNVITIDGTTYTKDLRDGKWWEYKPQSTPTSDGFKESFDFKDEEKDKPETEKTKYTKIGKEACGSLTCFKYQVVEPGITGTSYIWFDDRDYQLRRMQTTEDGEVNDMTFSYTKPNITKPSPIKQGNPGEMNNFAPEI